MSRLAAPTAPLRVVSVDRPFSNFDFVDQEFFGWPPIRRLFSLARSRKARTLVIEEVPAEGAVADENGELLEYFPDYSMGGLRRLSFWCTAFTTADEIAAQPEQDCIGWAILKLDICPARKKNKWHVFESVIRKYAHEHNYVPCAHAIPFRVGDRTISLPGVLYCQQNGLNKACAQVSIRAVASAYLNNPDLTFRQINRLAGVAGASDNPGAGLDTDQIQSALDGLGVQNFSIYYPHYSKRLRNWLPYHKILYSGIECGCGSLLAFRTSGPRAQNCGHIIPVFGHTFNEDTWAPRSEGAYFKIGREIQYIPSSAWMSSFIGHDDNFGSNLCVPKDYVSRGHADYAVALYPLGYAAPGFIAEVAASRYFYSLIRELKNSGNRWLDRLLDVARKELILRTVAITREEYTAHHSAMEDWRSDKEDPEVVAAIATMLPEKMWMIEISVPDLFSTNLRKLGELLLDGALTISDRADYSKFVLGRFPGRYVFFERLDGRKHPRFIVVTSKIESHTPLWKRIF
jgi:hypothetical protein